MSREVLCALPVLLLTLMPLCGACGRGPTDALAQAPATSSAPPQAEPRAASAELRRLPDDQVDTELHGVAERILDEHSEEAIGTEIPFEHEGRRYVARIEEHDNEEEDPTRPAGKHKGVSLFARGW